MTDKRNPLPDDPEGDDITAEFMASAPHGDDASNPSPVPAHAAGEGGKVHGVPERGERRSRRRSLISAPVRVRKIGATHGDPADISTTVDVSRNGILFVSSHAYVPGTEVSVTFPFSQSGVTPHAEQTGRVVRVSPTSDGRSTVGLALIASSEESATAAAPREAVEDAAPVSYQREPGSMKPLVLAVDADAGIRATMKSYLTGEGYEVIAVRNAAEARNVLSEHVPSLLIAEIEGEDFPGLDLCAYVKSTPRLQAIPVMMLTSSAYPSDYANAHSLGAVVCMAKPYRQERLGHVVRLLAPPPEAKEQPAPPRAAGHKRKPGSAHGGSVHGASGHANKPTATSKSSFRSRFRLSR